MFFLLFAILDILFHVIEAQVNTWSYPPATIDASQPLVLELGTNTTLRWSTEYPNIYLCLSIPDDDPKTLLDDVPNTNEYTWAVNPYCDDCDVPDLPDEFKLYIVNSADTSACFYSPAFSISEAVVSPSVSSRVPVTSSVSPVTTSIQSATTSIASTTPTSIESRPSTASLKLGLGIGLGLGIPLILLLGILVGSRLRSKKTSYVSSFSASEPLKYSSKGISNESNPYGIAL